MENAFLNHVASVIIELEKARLPSEVKRLSQKDVPGKNGIMELSYELCH